MTVRLPFWKVQSIGNDFPLFHLGDLQLLLGEDSDALYPNMAKATCDRHFGIGGDGLLVMGRAKDGLTLRMFNPDGTEDFCGNGLRCAALHGSRMGWVQGRFFIHHRGRRVQAWLEGNRVNTVIDPATYAPDEVPLVEGSSELYNAAVIDGVLGSSLSTGSTHTIVPVSDLPSDREFMALGPKIENAPIFPERTSVVFSRPVAPNRLEIRIWERGVGETLGCGTGSSAAAADYLRRTGGGGVVQVQNPGGVVEVEMAAWDAPILVRSTAEEVYEGEYRWERRTGSQEGA